MYMVTTILVSSILLDFIDSHLGVLTNKGTNSALFATAPANLVRQWNITIRVGRI